MRAVGWEFKKARNLFTNVLRGPSYDDAFCLVFIAGFISIFLFQVEPLLWRRGIFRGLETHEGKWPFELNPLSGFWLLPFEWMSSGTKGSLWILVVIVYFVNAVFVDRFVAKHSGSDVGFRPSVLTLRRLLAGVPVLGLCVIPVWRILWNHKPEWATRRAAPRLVLEGDPPDLLLLHRGAYLHSGPFLLWILISNFFALRAAMTWLNEPERATATGLLIVQGVCGGLRLGGLLCMWGYIHLRSRGGDLWGRRKSGLLVCSGAWLLPKSLFLLPVAALLFVGERWGTVVSDARVQSGQEREADLAVGSQFSKVPDFRKLALDRATLKLFRFYREKTFLLMAEVASVMMLVLPLREHFPLISLPGCIISLMFLAALGSFPIGGILYGRFLFRAARSNSASGKRHQVEPLFARYLVLSSLAVIGGFNIGITAGARELKTLALLLFWIGAYGSAIGFLCTIWGVLKIGDKSLLIWPILFLCIGLTGHRMQQSSLEINVLGLHRHIENAAQFHLFKLYLMIPLVFVLTVFVGILRCRWLLQPFRVQDIFNPDLPVRLRWRLALLVVTACLPLGGFLVPVWIRMRAALVEQPLPV